MDRRVSRRTILRSAAVGATVGLAGCGAFDAPDRSKSAPSVTYAGRVTDLDGDPVGGATVEAVVGPAGPLATTTTDGSGAFELSAQTEPVLLRVDHPDFLTETRAFGPGSDVRIPITSAENTVSIAFGGDVMFGRRFYAANDDPLEPQARIHGGSRRADHDRILQYVAPLFDGADVGSVNLETPLTTSAWRHPTKEYQFTSHPVAAAALADAGVDYTSLGNNHTFDALEPGLRETLSAVESAGIAHSGAGLSSEAAWTPALVERDDVTVAFVSCTTVTGDQHGVDWSADATGRGPYTVTQDGASLTFGDGMGSADATPERVDAAVTAAGEEADVVVVEIHGGVQSRRTPTREMRRLVDAATEAGADLVVNHHPHVTGGVERRNGALVAWTLGNLVFDQELAETLRSYVLVAHVTPDGVRRAYTQPLVVDGYVPSPTTSTLARRLSWETAGLSGDAATLVSHGHRLETGQFADTVSDPRQRIQQVSGDGIYARRFGWIDGASADSGSVRLGRDRLFSGAFDDNAVGTGHGPLWRFNREDEGRGVGYENTRGVRLTAYPEDTRRSVLSPASRLPITDNPLTLTGRYRYADDGGLFLLVSWYNAGRGISIRQRTVELGGTGGEWGRFSESLEPPEQATYVNFFVYLYPPDGDDPRRVSLDDIRLVEWADPDVSGGRQYDHARVRGGAKLELHGVAAPPNEWVPLSDS